MVSFYVLLFNLFLFTTNANVNSAVFQAGGLVVVLVEVTRKSYLASLVPVIVNAVLNDHQIVTDIVAFVSLGDFPRSRLGEKQRGKILGSWVTRKMRTIAQFSIRDADGADPQMLQSRMSKGSKPSSFMERSSLRRSTLVPDSDSGKRAAPEPVQDRPELVDEPYPQEDEEEKHYQDLLNDPAYAIHNEQSRAVSSPPINAAASATQPLTIDVHNGYEQDKNPTPVLTPDHGFDFGDSFDQSTYDDGYQSRGALTARNVPSVAIAPPSTAGSQDSRTSYRNATKDSSNSSNTPPGRPQHQMSASQFADTAENESWLDISQRQSSTEDWPQEALLYQSHLNSQGGNEHFSNNSGRFNVF